MRSKKRIAICILAVVVAIASLFTTAFLFLGSRTRIDEETADQIQPGMTRAEVETLLGRPPGDYTTRAHDYPPFDSRYWGWDCWLADGGAIRVDFNKEGKVRDKDFRVYPVSELTLWERARKRLGL